MTASKLNPPMHKGEIVSGGNFRRNEKPSSANAPDYKGRLYLKGIGWHWLAGWERNGPYGTFLSLSAQEMTDEQVTKYMPQDAVTKKYTPRQPVPTPSNGAEPTDGDIPF